MNTKKRAFQIGLIFLFAALLSITVLPVLVKKYTSFNFSEILFTQIEFFLLFWCACLYMYSGKYYKYQMLSILSAFAFYIAFAWFFN